MRFNKRLLSSFYTSQLASERSLFYMDIYFTCPEGFANCSFKVNNPYFEMKNVVGDINNVSEQVIQRIRSDKRHIKTFPERIGIGRRRVGWGSERIGMRDWIIFSVLFILFRFLRNG